MFISIGYFLKIAGIVVTLYEFFAIIQKVYQALKGKKMNVLLKNPNSRALIIVLPITIIIFLIPWNKFYYGEAKPVIKYVDSSKSNKKPQPGASMSGRSAGKGYLCFSPAAASILLVARMLSSRKYCRKIPRSRKRLACGSHAK